MEERRENKKREKGLERMEVGLNTLRSRPVLNSFLGLRKSELVTAYCGSCLDDHRLVIRMK